MNIPLLQAKIDQCRKLCIEIGGPTPRGYVFLEELSLKLPKKILVTNISNPVILNPFGERAEKYRVDAVIDITSFPYHKGEVDMLLASSLPHKLHKTLITEAAKALRKQGLLIIENELPEDKKFAIQAGFAPLFDYSTAQKYYSQIYQLNPTDES